MKAFFKIAVATVMAAALVVIPLMAADQYGIDNTVTPSNYSHNGLTTNTGPILVAGSFTTNLPANAQRIVAVPSTGFGVYLRTGGTNAADTTNLVIVLEGVIFPTGLQSGGTQVVDNATITISTPTTATALPTGYDYLTNFPANSSGLASVLGRCDGIRVKSIQNTNLNSIWVSNLFLIKN